MNKWLSNTEATRRFMTWTQQEHGSAETRYEQHAWEKFVRFNNHPLKSDSSHNSCWSFHDIISKFSVPNFHIRSEGFWRHRFDVTSHFSTSDYLILMVFSSEHRIEFADVIPLPLSTPAAVFVQPKFLYTLVMHSSSYRGIRTNTCALRMSCVTHIGRGSKVG